MASAHSDVSLAALYSSWRRRRSTAECRKVMWTTAPPPPSSSTAGGSGAPSKSQSNASTGEAR
eukprot:CAMPEP_0171640496 /NCGR_PEP_ID=MMETSP0990-20121206/30503_1 /TAXON_ID=483369 /ORGANISM="non described non described, Strain CCMP2098" /LENGTH=62 /DNA_ID=CAMNT_0012214755 /DNA_START=474 /DNA_END=662 /DNA_ORIENTATION=+